MRVPAGEITISTYMYYTEIFYQRALIHSGAENKLAQFLKKLVPRKKKRITKTYGSTPQKLVPPRDNSVRNEARKLTKSFQNAKLNYAVAHVSSTPSILDN